MNTHQQRAPDAASGREQAASGIVAAAPDADPEAGQGAPGTAAQAGSTDDVTSPLEYDDGYEPI